MCREYAIFIALVNNLLCFLFFGCCLQLPFPIKEYISILQDRYISPLSVKFMEWAHILPAPPLPPLLTESKLIRVIGLLVGFMGCRYEGVCSCVCHCFESFY